jgi:hypothetical protein
VLPKYHTIPAADTSGTETWYFGTEYNDGYPGSVTGFTSSNYYTINKAAGTPPVITVTGVY